MTMLREIETTPEVGREVTRLSSVDQVWLDAFDVQLDWDDQQLISELNELVEIGSVHAHSSIPAKRQRIMDARRQFYQAVGFDESLMVEVERRCPAFAPIDTFISGQRMFQKYGMDGKRIIENRPGVIAFDGQAIEERLASLTAHGIDAPRAASNFPHLLTLSLETVDRKFAIIREMGLDVVKIATVWPSGLGQSPETLQKRMELFAELDIDGIKLTNTAPSLLSLPLESIPRKIQHFKTLGLDATRIVSTHPTLLTITEDKITAKLDQLRELGITAEHLNRQPSLLGYRPEFIAGKRDILERTCRVLGWEYDAQALIDVMPGVLAFDQRKLGILARIASTVGTSEDRAATPLAVAGMLRRPLESYLVAASREDGAGLRSLYVEVRKDQLAATERKAAAMQLAVTGQLGQIGLRYLQYSSHKLNNTSRSHPHDHARTVS